MSADEFRRTSSHHKLIGEPIPSVYSLSSDSLAPEASSSSSPQLVSSSPPPLRFFTDKGDEFDVGDSKGIGAGARAEQSSHQSSSDDSSEAELEPDRRRNPEPPRYPDSYLGTSRNQRERHRLQPRGQLPSPRKARRRERQALTSTAGEHAPAGSSSPLPQLPAQKNEESKKQKTAENGTRRVCAEASGHTTGCASGGTRASGNSSNALLTTVGVASAAAIWLGMTYLGG